MTWNYRRMLIDGVYSIREVYYSKEGKPEMYSSFPSDPFGETRDELKKDYDLMASAFDKPILKPEDFISHEG